MRTLGLQEVEEEQRLKVILPVLTEQSTVRPNAHTFQNKSLFVWSERVTLRPEVSCMTVTLSL